MLQVFRLGICYEYSPNKRYRFQEIYKAMNRTPKMKERKETKLKLYKVTALLTILLQPNSIYEDKNDNKSRAAETNF